MLWQLLRGGIRCGFRLQPARSPRAAGEHRLQISAPNRRGNLYYI